MKIAEEATVEAGSEEISKPIVKGLITCGLAVVVEWFEKHEHFVVVLAAVGGLLTGYAVCYFQHRAVFKSVKAAKEAAKLERAEQAKAKHKEHHAREAAHA